MQRPAQTQASPDNAQTPYTRERAAATTGSGPPGSRAGERRFTTLGGMVVRCTATPAHRSTELAALVDALDSRRGLLLSSGYEVPGRYRRYDIGFVDPPLSLTARGRDFELRALSPRGQVLLHAAGKLLAAAPELRMQPREGDVLRGHVPAAAAGFTEEERTRQPTVLSVVRRLVGGFAAAGQPHFGLYGAFGYDLGFQFDELTQRMPRAADQRDLVLYLPDRLVVCDLERGTCERLAFEFDFDGQSTEGLEVGGESRPPQLANVAAEVEPVSDHAPGQYAALVRHAHGHFARGELFEVTPGQTFSAPCHQLPSALFARLQRDNPAPYAFLANLGEGEHLVGASPEMFVRVRGRRVETCPIAGTIARGGDALQDAEQVLTLLSCDKAVSELTMCTDVDRNDKARVCEPGSVRVIGRRQVEMYSRLIHTVDHVEGQLRQGFDALDAFITHCWAVTVTGAPKHAAMQFIEDHEASPRRFYSGAIGVVGFDGSLNTGLTLRTIRVADGRAEVRAGATLLHASDPEEEQRECELKASALLSVLRPEGVAPAAPAASGGLRSTAGARGPREPRLRRVLLVDHRDSFVHMLGDYFRQAGAEVRTLRAGFDHSQFEALSPELVVLSPGPGKPDDFGTRATLAAALSRGLPVFGVCLGLQAIVEYFGGTLGTLGTPRHGRASSVVTDEHPLFEGLPSGFGVGRYHSLFGRSDGLPKDLRAIAHSEDDGCIMAVAHRSLPVSAVQFHPESLMSAGGGHGLRLVQNVLA